MFNSPARWARAASGIFHTEGQTGHMESARLTSGDLDMYTEVI